jgi:hypothetical protein
MSKALDSVKSWASLNSFDYVFVGDEFFDYAPAWVHERCGAQRLPVTDVARLYLLAEVLGRGYERVIWLDADVLVFDPDGLVISSDDGHAFCRQVVLARDFRGATRISPPGVNNAVMSFQRGNPMLDFYRLAAERILAAAPPGEVGRTLLGPDFLSALAMLVPLGLVRNVGLFSPLLMEGIATGNLALYRAYLGQYEMPLAATNICHSFRPPEAGAGQIAFDQLFDLATERLLATRGCLS